MVDVAAGSEIRLGLLLLLNAAVGVTAWRFARRARPGGDWVDGGADAFVVYYLVQYLAVGVPGVMGVLGPVSIGVTAVALNVVLWVGATVWWPEREGVERGRVGVWPGAWLGFVVGNLGALVVYYGRLPVMSQDALTYHFPAAAMWLREGRIGVWETWFFNPANAYSPLAGSTFVAWLLGPLGNDTVASFVQVPALVGVWFVAVRLAREVGMGVGWGAIVATAVVVAQPFIRASVLSKDDLFVAMFFGAGLAGMSKRLAGDGLGAWRVGVAVGLMLATKYTVLLGVPVLLLAGDGLRRAGWGWKRWVVAAGCVLAIAGPWYGRNLVAYGNPVFPVSVLGLPGLMEVRTSEVVRSGAGIWRVMTGVDDALPAWLLAVVVVGWAVWVGVEWRRVVREPVWRAVALGPVVVMGLFLWKAPYAEVRFLYPVILLGMVGMGAGVWRVSGGRAWGWAVMALIAAGAAVTGLPVSHAVKLLPVGVGVAGLVALGVWVMGKRSWDWTHGVVAGVVGMMVIAAGIYVYWPAYVRQSAEIATDFAWPRRYGVHLANAWKFVRELPAGERVAYANTYLLYPLMGFEPVRPVGYVPVRTGVRRLADLPHLGRVSGDEIVRRVAEVTNGEPDEGAWLEGIRESGARYLFVEKRAGVGEPPELGMAGRNPGRFAVVFDNAAARVYVIR